MAVGIEPTFPYGKSFLIDNPNSCGPLPGKGSVQGLGLAADRVYHSATPSYCCPFFVTGLVGSRPITKIQCWKREQEEIPVSNETARAGTSGCTVSTRLRIELTSQGATLTRPPGHPQHTTDDQNERQCPALRQFTSTTFTATANTYGEIRTLNKRFLRPSPLPVGLHRLI
jgi:hypothetical protein